MESSPDSKDETDYDVIIIGAGMAGLAAGIRVALSGRQVLVLEKHEAPGGLNSFYRLDGRMYDVGLHAMTNYAEAGDRGTPLNKIFRQLRIARDSFDLNPQIGSKVVFPDASLRFTNDPDVLESEIARQFPNSIDGYRKLVTLIKERDATSLNASAEPTLPVLEKLLPDSLLREMLLCPIMYYGSATEDDLDFDQFVILFRSLFLEGFARPFQGVRAIIQALLKKYKEVGGQRRMRCGVEKLVGSKGHIQEVHLEDGRVLRAKTVLSTAGLVETRRMCGIQSEREPVGPLSFVETMSVYEENPYDFGWQDTITFFSTQSPFRYRRPEGLVDDRSGVICVPNNYQYSGGRSLPEGMVRVTAMANYDQWKSLSPDDYLKEKGKWFAILSEVSKSILPPTDKNVQPALLARDMFTPLTVEKYTGHLRGAVYGSTEKSKDGRTEFENLFLCGTDQGFLGIVGAMLSGISIANRYVVSG